MTKDTILGKLDKVKRLVNHAVAHIRYENKAVDMEDIEMDMEEAGDLLDQAYDMIFQYNIHQREISKLEP